MFRGNRWISLTFLFRLCLVWAAPVAMAWAQPAAPGSGESQTVRLQVHPAEPPPVAMKHRLLPGYLDLVPGNAAVQYLKALPEGGDDTIKKHAERMAQLLDQSRDKFEVDEARKIVQEFGTLYEFLRLGSVRDECDWGMPIREQNVYSILLPELQSMRQFGRFLALKARVQIADGQFEPAIETLRIGYAAARNAAQGPTLVNALVGIAIARMMNERLLELIQSPEAPNLYWSIAALPDPFIDIRRAMDLESDSVYLMFPQLKDVATAKLTEEQWNARLATFSEKLHSLGPIDVPEGNWKDWAGRLARGIGVNAMAAVHYSRAKADLETYGWSKDEVDQMVIAQVVLLHIGQTYEIFRDDLFKWFHVPFWQAEAGMRSADETLAKSRSREILPLASLLLPALSQARFAVARLDRDFAAIRTIEALRLYASRHDGQLPTMLSEIKEVPLPLDPVTGKLFDYVRDGQTAKLQGLSPAGRTSQYELRFVITIVKKGQEKSATHKKKENR